MFIYIVYIVTLWWSHTQPQGIHQAAASTHIPAASAQPADNINAPKKASIFFVCAHIEICCRSTSKNKTRSRLSLETLGTASSYQCTPVSARHSLGRRTPPRRPHHPSRSSRFLQKPPFSIPKTAPSSCCAQDHRLTTCFLFRAQKPLFWPQQALQGMTSHAVRTAPARLHALWRNKILPLPTRVCTSMPPAATAFAVIASRFQHCAAEHVFAVADSKQTHLLMMRHVSQACEQSHTLQQSCTDRFNYARINYARIFES